MATVAVMATFSLIGAACGCAAPTPSGPPGAFTLFNQLRADHCTDEYPLSNAVRAKAGPRAHEFTMTLENGDRMILNSESEVVYSMSGPEDELPSAYSFGCDPDVFQGTLHA